VVTIADEWPPEDVRDPRELGGTTVQRSRTPSATTGSSRPTWASGAAPGRARAARNPRRQARRPAA
jgi:hypothetical protein